MKRLIVSLVSMYVFALAGPVYADSMLQIWECSVNEGHTADDVLTVSKDWLDAARKMEGGKDLQVTIEFPEVTGGKYNAFNFVLSASDLKTWGLFNNDYQGSAAAAADEKFLEVAICDGSRLWASIDIK